MIFAFSFYWVWGTRAVVVAGAVCVDARLANRVELTATAGNRVEITSGELNAVTLAARSPHECE